MHLRPMVPKDFSEAADVGSKAFWNDELFGWLCEARVDYPEDFRNFFLRSIGRKYHSVGSHWVVVETDTDSKGNKKVVGYARWEREGSSPSAKEWQRDSLYKRVERGLRYLENEYVRIFHFDRSLDNARMAEWESQAENDHSGEEEKWHLQELAVAPSFQRQGVGGMLIDWGLERAREENIPAMLESSQAGHKLYQKKGFQITGMLSMSEDVNGYAMMWYPDGYKKS